LIKRKEFSFSKILTVVCQRNDARTQSNIVDEILNKI